MTLYQEVFSTAHCGPAPARAPQDRTTEQDLLLWALSTQRTVTAPEGSGAEFALIHVEFRVQAMDGVQEIGRGTHGRVVISM